MSDPSSGSRVVVITGASSGIGTVAARMFAQRGDRVVLAARRVERLTALSEELARAGGESLVVQADLARTEEAKGLVEATVDAWGRIDVLVNNAGFGAQRWFEEMTADEVAGMFHVNVLSAMELARRAVPLMRAQGGGSIVNVASVGGLVAHPLNVAYCATKHALVGFSKSLRLELKGTGIRVSAVCPGATKTEFFDLARGEIPFGRMIDTFAVSSETAARCIVDASEKNRAVVFPTRGAWFLHFVDKWFPWISEAGNLRYRKEVLGRAEKSGPAH